VDFPDLWQVAVPMLEMLGASGEEVFQFAVFGNRNKRLRMGATLAHNLE